MQYQTLAAGIFSAAVSAGATDAQQALLTNLEELDQIETCINEAIDSIDIGGTQRVYDPDSQSIQRYLSGPHHLIGITAEIDNPWEINNIGDHAVTFHTKFYQENEGRDDIDMHRPITINFLGTETLDTNQTPAMSYNPAHMISDFDNPPSYTEEETLAREWAHNAGAEAALRFTVCMNLAPYAPSFFGQTEEVVPAVLPDFVPN